MNYLISKLFLIKLPSLLLTAACKDIMEVFLLMDRQVPEKLILYKVQILMKKYLGRMIQVRIFKEAWQVILVLRLVKESKIQRIINISDRYRMPQFLIFQIKVKIKTMEELFRDHLIIYFRISKHNKSL